MRKQLGSTLTAIGAVALLLISQFVVLFAWLAADVFILGRSLSLALDRVTRSTVAITLLSSLTTLGILAVIALIRKQHPLKAAHFFPMRGMLWPLCLGFGLGLNLFVTVLLNCIPFPEGWVDSYSSSSSLLAIDNVWLYLAAVVIATPLAEEVVFRRLAYGGFRQCMSPAAAALLSAVIFGVCHGTLLWMIYTVPLALIMCHVYDRCGSLWGSVMLHIGFNAGSVFFEYLPESTPDGALWLIFAAGLAVSLGCYMMIRKQTQHPRLNDGGADGDDAPMEK